MSAPSVSIITATYNGARLLPATIQTVLAQTVSDWEMVIVDDCSTDDTVATVERFGDPRIRIVRQPENGGVVRARNRAVALARGRHIAALDHDDLCRPDRLEQQLEVLEANPSVAMVGAAADHLEHGRVRPGYLPRPTTAGLLRWLMLVRNPFVWSSVMIRGDAARALVPFQRIERQYAEDFDLYHRLGAMGDLVRIDEPLLLYRVHDGGASNVHEGRMVDATAAVLAEAYAPVLGGYAHDAAMLVAQHVGAGRPAHDPETLAALAAILDRLHEAFVARHAPGDACREAIAAELSCAWWKVVQRAIRSGEVDPARALQLRPHAIGAPELDPGGFIASRLIGRGRSLMHRARH